MSLLWKLVFFSRCTSTHHKLALDALRFVRGPQADLWSNLFLANHEMYLTGSKAPDNEFKDFKNHVLHVEDGFWGGATTTARSWYQKTVAALSQGDWPEAVYNAGVLSHYFTDPFQPFHTGQTEAEGKVHRAAEWSICKSYDELQSILEHDLTGYPEWELAVRPDWLEEAIRQGALAAHQDYDVCIDHYDLSRGIKHPPSGLDQEMKDRLARLIGLAVTGFARVLERAFEESAASPPDVAVSLHVFLATLKMPVNWITRKLSDLHERAVVEAIYLEVQEKGKVIDALPEDERQVRKAYAQEILKVPVRTLDAQPAKATGTQFGTGAPARGPVATPVSPASFQRTTTSAPQWLEARSCSGTAIESCLTVPLAAAPSVDYVKEAAVRAYLGQVSRPSPALSANPPHEDGGLIAPGTGDIQQGVTTPSVKEPVARPDRPQPSIAPLSAPTKSDLDREERRLERQRQRGPQLEPAVPAPELPAPARVSLGSGQSLTELPADMFAPLPPMPRVTNREKEIPQPLAGQSKSAPATVPPAPPKVATKAPEAPRPRTAAPAATPVSPTVQPKNYQAHPSVSSAVPTPHIRMPQVTVEESQTEDEIEDETPVGQSSRFDFQSFSGIQPPASTPASIPAPTPAARPASAPINRPTTVETQTPAARSETPATRPTESRRFYLELSQPVVDAPSIGPKTAERLHAIGIHTVADLLRADPQQGAAKLGNPAANLVIREWQAQTALVCRVPNLRGHDAQFIVACQVRTAEQLRACDPHQLLQKVDAFVKTSPGQRLLRGGKAPDLAEVTEWIVAARDARSLS